MLFMGMSAIKAARDFDKAMLQKDVHIGRETRISIYRKLGRLEGALIRVKGEMAKIRFIGDEGGQE